MIYILFLILTFSHPSLAQNSKCLIQESDWKIYFAMDFQTFDQTLGKGWRVLSEKDCPIEAAIVIDQYYYRHISTLTQQQKRILYWHAGQNYAAGGLENIALIRFRYSFDPDESIEAPFKWNAYVAATIAFLKKDLKRLIQERDKIAQYPNDNGINLTIINNMIMCPDSPYRTVLSGTPLQECYNERLGSTN